MNEIHLLGFEKWQKVCKKRAEGNYFILFGFDQLKEYIKKLRPDWTEKEIEINVLGLMACSNQKKNILKVKWNKIKPLKK